MSKELNKKLLTKISGLIPADVKLIDYLVDTLEISKESIYRRLRGDILFTFGEISILSAKLGFSVDEIINTQNYQQASFKLQSLASFTPEESFRKMLEYYYDYLLHLHKAQQREVTVTMNRLVVVFILNFDNLFKFYYYKWTHQIDKVPLNFYFSDLEIPADILILRNEILKYTELIGDTTYIIDKDVYSNTFREIQYYHGRKLVSDEELLLIKKDLFSFLDMTEKLTQKGKNHLGATSSLYLSDLNIESNSSYVKFDENEYSFFWIYSVGPMGTENHEVSKMHKKWVNSLKKYSTLITLSNESLASDFFDEQRENLDTILSIKRNN